MRQFKHQSCEVFFACEGSFIFTVWPSFSSQSQAGCMHELRQEMETDTGPVLK
jgi:hypothetical protein